MPFIRVDATIARPLCSRLSSTQKKHFTMDRLKGKRALITGGTTGIGLETAKQFISEGARVAITGRNPATLEAARHDLGAAVLIIPSDAGSVAAQKQVAETIQGAFGGLDVLFVNAGIAELKPVEQW